MNHRMEGHQNCEEGTTTRWTDSTARSCSRASAILLVLTEGALARCRHGPPDVAGAGFQAVEA